MHYLGEMYMSLGAWRRFLSAGDTDHDEDKNLG